MDGRVAPNELSPFELDLAEKTMLLRGSILSSYAQVEFLLADLPVRCSRVPGLSHLVEGFPYQLEARMRATLILLKRGQALRRYRTEAKPLVQRLEAFEPLRHFLAHGFLIIESASDDLHRVIFKLYEPTGDRGAVLRTFPTNLMLLTKAADDVGAYAQRFVLLWRRIYAEQGLGVGP